MVMEYQKMNLYEVVTLTKNILEREQILVLIYNMLCAPKFLHSANIVHRDLKSQNIMVSNQMEV